MSFVNFEIHESHAPLWERSDWRYAIIMGGRGNGRSGTASRFVISQLLGKEYTRGAIMRAVHSDIRASCWSELLDRLNEQGITETFKANDGDMYLERGANSVRAHGFKSSSGALTARLKSLAGYNLLWIEEAEEVGEEDFMKLDESLRTVKGRIRIVLTLNTPVKGHWILNKWFELDPHPEAPGFYIPRLRADATDTIFIGGTYRENLPNLDPHTVEIYERQKHTNPSRYWQVIEGLAPDQVRGKIYTGWQLIDQIPPEARLVRFGEDFGWFPDPACAVAVYYWNGSYIIDELAYGTELTNEHLAKCIREAGTAITIADSAEPKSIAEQRKYGISVNPCEKGKDSVRFGIQIVNQKKIYVTRRSKNVWESYENYAWDEDKDGNSKNEPAHKYSHAMDAVRYAITSLHGKPTAAVPSGPRHRVNVAV